MRLASFITANTEPILTEWVAFAKTCGPPGREFDVTRLRDHAAEMLRTIVRDLDTPQSDSEQAAKSQGHADAHGARAEDAEDDSGETAAEIHGAGRAEDGFTIDEMVSEYRALRASVLRLWAESNPTLTLADFQDLMRFNEAIDQSLAESTTRFTQDLDYAKEMFVAVLGHDLRSPLSAILMVSEFMRDSTDLAEPYRGLTGRVVSSASRMTGMVNDLLDFTRSRLGPGIPIERQAADLAEVTHDAVEEIRAANPASVLLFETHGDLHGHWDTPRISQTLGNLLGNAVQHGAPGTPIRVSVQGDGDEVTLRVHNHGPRIPSAKLASLFSPFKRLRAGKPADGATHHLGLGLFIVERIVTAHAGTIEVTSSKDGGTAFLIRLPREARSAERASADKPRILRADDRRRGDRRRVPR